MKQTQFDLTKHIMQNVNKNNSGLMQREYDVLLHLSMHRNGDTGRCFPSVETLANECHIMSRTVNEAVRGLEAKGWMTHTKGGLRGNKAVSNDYVLNVEKIMACVATVKESKVAPTVKTKDIVADKIQNVSKNPDGSPLFFPNGNRRHSWDQDMHSNEDESEDSPF